MGIVFSCIKDCCCCPRDKIQKSPTDKTYLKENQEGIYIEVFPSDSADLLQKKNEEIESLTLEIKNLYLQISELQSKLDECSKPNLNSKPKSDLISPSESTSESSSATNSEISRLKLIIKNLYHEKSELEARIEESFKIHSFEGTPANLLLSKDIYIGHLEKENEGLKEKMESFSNSVPLSKYNELVTYCQTVHSSYNTLAEQYKALHNYVAAQKNPPLPSNPSE